MIVTASPTTLRIAAISNGEQTIARAPALVANCASATALSKAGFAKPTENKSSSDNEVKIVTAVMSI